MGWDTQLDTYGMKKGFILVHCICSSLVRCTVRVCISGCVHRFVGGTQTHLVGKGFCISGLRVSDQFVRRGELGEHV